MSCNQIKKQQSCQKQRTLDVNTYKKDKDIYNQGYCSNQIRTSKYNM